MQAETVLFSRCKRRGTKKHEQEVLGVLAKGTRAKQRSSAALPFFPSCCDPSRAHCLGLAACSSWLLACPRHSPIVAEDGTGDRTGGEEGEKGRLVGSFRFPHSTAS